MKINGGLVTPISITSDKIPNSAGVIFHILDNLASLPQTRIRQAEQKHTFKWGLSCTEGVHTLCHVLVSYLLPSPRGRS